MARATHLRMQDVVSIMRLLVDVAALKSDPAIQRQELINGLNRLIGTNQSFFFVADGWRPDLQQRWAHRTLSHDVDPVVLRYMGEFGVRFPILADPFGSRSVADPSRVQVRTLDQVLPDRASREAHEPFMDIVSTGCLTDGVVAFHRTRADPRRIVGVGMHRFRSSGKLTPRQIAMVRLATEELERMVEAGHFTLPKSADAGSDLSPRLHQVLDLLLAGHAPKRIALQLGLSIWTVREYIQNLYTHFRVNGRDELMSRFVGAGPPAPTPIAG